MSALLIRGGRLIDPASGRDGRFDLLIENGLVSQIADADQLSAEIVFEAAGCWVVPGLIDMHVHLREPGYEYKETIATGSLAAVAGGFTAVACMANTLPVNDSGAVTEYILERAREVDLARVYPIGAVSVGLAGEQLAEIGEMHRAGIVAISDDGHPVHDGDLMRRALEYGCMFDLPVIAHEEDPGLTGGGCMHEGATSFRLGLKGVPAAAEEVMVARDIAIVEQTPGRLHIAHASTAGTVRLVRGARERGLPVTAEVTPHHLTLTDEAVDRYDTNAKMNPPLRTREDVQALLQGLKDGVIGVIASDHAPHHRDEKEVEFAAAAPGIIGLETTLPLALSLVRDAGVPLETVLRAMTIEPARILGLPGGHLAPGAPADVTVIDPERQWRVDPTTQHSKSQNTPFSGWSMIGGAAATIVAGRLVWDASGSSDSSSRVRGANG